MTSEIHEAPRRPYRKAKRAESEQGTRLRITEAAVALHQIVGPGRTSVKAIAERAGVERATVYRHFPTEEELFAACTSHYYAQHPFPDPTEWAAMADPDERLKAALVELYAWFEETEEMLAPGIRDIDKVPAGARNDFLAYFEAGRAALMVGRRERAHRRVRVSGAIGHATAFSTWRSLVREQNLPVPDAISLMTAMVDGAHRGPTTAG